MFNITDAQARFIAVMFYIGLALTAAVAVSLVGGIGYVLWLGVRTLIT